MDRATLTAIVIAIATIGVLIWSLAIRTMLRAAGARRERARRAADRFEVEGEAPDGSIVGEVEVDGRPEALSETLAAILARDGLGPIGPVKILSRDDREITFQYTGAFGSGSVVPRPGRIRLEGSGSKTRLDYLVEAPGGRLLMGLGWLFVALGGLALFGGTAFVFTVVLPDPNPGFRTQAVQLVQAGHFLWPPLLFAKLSDQPARLLRDRIESLLHNLPFA